MSDEHKQEEIDRWMKRSLEYLERETLPSSWDWFLRPGRQTISYKELPPPEPGSVLFEEHQLYRTELERLLEEGHEGKFIVIKGSAIVGIHESHDEALRFAYRQFGSSGFLCRPILSREPILRVRV